MITIIKTILIALILTSCALGIKDIPTSKIEQKYANPKDGSRFITIDNTRVHYRAQGNVNGQAIVLLHGIVSSLHTWDGWVDILKKKYYIIRLDIPGFGLTGAIRNNQYTSENYVDFLDKFLIKLNLQKVSLIGNSLGGFIAWNFAATHPAKVEKLILIDPAAYPFNPPWIVKVAAIPGISETATLVSPRFIAKLGLEDVYGKGHTPSEAVIDRYYEIFLKEGNREMAAKVFLDLLKYRNSYPKKIKEIKSPTFVMWGGEDSFIPVYQHLLWKKDLPNASYKIYKGLGHMPMEESPEITAIDADKFLSGI